MISRHTLPIPAEDRRRSGPKPLYPYRELAVRESFIIHAPVNLRQAQNYACRRSRQLGKTFRCARLPNGDVQVWRVA